jgi:hypothetical protein
LVSREQAADWCRTAASNTIMGSHPLPHFEASAKTSESVEEAFQEAARRALVYEEHTKKSQPQLFIPPPINLRGHNNNGGSGNNNSQQQCC